MCTDKQHTSSVLIVCAHTAATCKAAVRACCVADTAAAVAETAAYLSALAACLQPQASWLPGPARSLCWHAAVPHRTQPKPKVLLQLSSVDGLQCLYRNDAVAADHLQEQGPTTSAQQGNTPGKGGCTGDARGTFMYVQGSSSCSCYFSVVARSVLP